MFTVSIDDGGMTQRLTALASRLEAIPQSVFQTIGEMFIESIHMNFEVGGRPLAWTPSKRAQETGGKTLIQSGALRDSGEIEEITANSVTVTWGNGLAFDYGVVHQFGASFMHPGSDKWQSWMKDGKRMYSHGTKPHNITIPQREFFNIQADFQEQAGQLLSNYIINGEQVL